MIFGAPHYQTAITPLVNSPPSSTRAVIAVLTSIWSGLVLTEQLSNNILPLTLRRFTENAGIIGLILAINPAFGFIVQPVVGILSDRIWTPLGRRRFFLVVCAPIVAGALWLMPHADSFWQVVVLVVVFQLFQDVLWGSEHPLMADMLPPEKRPLAKAFTTSSGQLVTFLFLQVGMGFALVRHGEGIFYVVAAAGHLGLVALPAMFLKEKPVIPLERPRLTLRRYVTDITQEPILRRFMLLAFTQAICFSVITGFVVLFAVQTAGIGRDEFGRAWSLQAVPVLFAAIPLGMLIERVPKSWALAAGYATMLAACLVGISAHSVDAFYVIALLFGIGWVLVEVTQKPFFSEYLPRDLVGQISGAYNVCFALGRTVALAGGGLLIAALGNNYRVIWVVAFVFGVVSAWLSTRIPDVRYLKQRNERLPT